jgi:hypothetical protein
MAIGRSFYAPVVAALIGLTACAGYVPGAKSYWDQQVEGLCKADGGITVYEEVHLTQQEYKALGGNDWGLAIPGQQFAAPGYPYIREELHTIINASNPEVGRGESIIRRRSDGKILGRSVQYWRRGGDLPTGLAHGSHYICPQYAQLSKDIFKVKAK